MTRGKRSWVFQLAWLGLLALVIFAGGLLVGAPAQAEGSSQPALQQTDYPIDGVTQEPFDDQGYPLSTDLPIPALTEQPPALTPSTLITPSATIPPDVFGTENAEMNASQVTPPGTATQSPSLTPYRSATPQVSGTPAVPAQMANPGPFQMDWGLFWIGFSVPVLAACGVVLYLLDRRPNLFRSMR